MKKKVYISVISFLALFIIGCNDNNIPEEKNTQEHNITIENPSADVQNDKDSLSSFYTNFVIQDKYRVYRIIEKSGNIDANIAIPDWQPEGDAVIDTADFVNMIDDEMSDITQKRIDFLKEKLKPSGMSKEWKDSKQLFMEFKTPYIKEYTSDIYAKAASRTETISAEGLWDFLLRNNQEAVDKYDVVCVSVNMYEEFYRFSNSTKLLIYGVPEETFESNLSTENGRYKYPKTDTILEKYHNGECQLDTIVEIELTKSGNYYMDFSEIIEKDEYKDIIMEMELTGEITDEYTYAWYGFEYKITNEQSYQDWKAENIDKFVY